MYPRIRTNTSYDGTRQCDVCIAGRWRSRSCKRLRSLHRTGEQSYNHRMPTFNIKFLKWKRSDNAKDENGAIIVYQTYRFAIIYLACSYLN